MSDTSLKEHWNRAWTTQDDTKVSWFQEKPEPSLSLVSRYATDRTAAIVDIGGGASRLVDALLDLGFSDLTVLDLAGSSLKIARQRLGERADTVTWIESDVLKSEPERRFDIWHDRATFHFLTDLADQQRYRYLLDRGLKPGGILILGTFAPDGPEKCSGLPVCRHDSATISHVLGDGYELVETLGNDHLTPAGRTQHFSYSVFRRSR
ncbi:class I SAM-dependent methyltransferase [Roseibium aggregatum]|uniref:Class I SAM-dependent methyltransferase n=1 Tax=Roseibium aggregatum TaxID=187304 RepID=A0A926NUZ7_9HYPH|nr:class I SAM-dependent methyltransferase [Roseibium aggregatum]MBD1546919.1 class I SAM-dependent methyltransferase [Roseibium aggregatum]